MHFKQNKMQPSYWGPSAWKFLHTISDTYPEHPTDEMKQKTKHFFMLLQDVLPCPLCRKNYKLHIEKYPLTDNILRTRETLSSWLIDIHNEVNKLTNKKVFSYKDVVVESHPLLTFSNIILIFFIVLLLLFILFFKR